MTAHRFYAAPTAFLGAIVTLSENETHHLRDVLRLSVGDSVNVFDGIGGEYVCRVDSITKRSSALELLRKVPAAAPESPLVLTIAAALLKGDKFDLVVKKCVELGVNGIVPLLTERCEMRLRDAAKRIDRWQKLIIDASRQCGRATLMTVSEPIDFWMFVGSNAEPGKCVLFSERSGRPFEEFSPEADITALIGPEGGWSDDELETAVNRAITVLTLGGRVLRAETASISIAAILQHKFGDIN